LRKRLMSLMGSKKMWKLCGWNSEHNNYACWSHSYFDEKNPLMNSNCKVYHRPNRGHYRAKTRGSEHGNLYLLCTTNWQFTFYFKCNDWYAYMPIACMISFITDTLNNCGRQKLHCRMFIWLLAVRLDTHTHQLIFCNSRF
jgi:hypothetical protein